MSFFRLTLQFSVSDFPSCSGCLICLGVFDALSWWRWPRRTVNISFNFSTYHFTLNGWNSSSIHLLSSTHFIIHVPELIHKHHHTHVKKIHHVKQEEDDGHEHVEEWWNSKLTSVSAKFVKFLTKLWFSISITIVLLLLYIFVDCRSDIMLR